MKNLLLLIIITFAFSLRCLSQDTVNNYSLKPQFVSKDSLVIKAKVVKVSDELEFFKYNLGKCQNEFSAGSLIFSTGIFVIATGAISINKNNEGAFIPALIFGGASTLAGAIIMIDSHKWIGRASVGVGGDGVKVIYAF